MRACIVYTWDHKSSASFWQGMKVWVKPLLAFAEYLYVHSPANPMSRQPILADEVQTFKALITVHKILQEGHPIVLKEAQSHTGWLESLSRGSTAGEGMRGYAPLISEYIYYLMAKLAFHRQHPEFNGTSASRRRTLTI